MSWWCSHCDCASAPSDDTCGEVIQRCEICGRAGVLNWQPEHCAKPRKPAAVLPARPQRDECTPVSPETARERIAALRAELEKGAVQS